MDPSNPNPSAGTPAERLVVIGQGYVGLPVAAAAAERGYDVVGFDVDEARVARIAAGDSPVEDITDQRLAAVQSTGSYRATIDPADLAGFDIAVVSVPTPLSSGAPDLSYIEQAARTVGGHLRPGACVILESTTYPGTTEELVAPILERASGLTAGRDFGLGYSPERIDPGNPVWHLENTPKVVSGIDAASLAAVQGFFDRIVDKTVAVGSPKEAELTKLLENTFRHVNIALVNELAMFAHELGIDVWEAIDAASTKPFGYMRFTPGPGVGDIACPSTRRTCHGRSSRPWARHSGSWNWPMTSTTTCPSTWCGDSLRGSMPAACPYAARTSCCSVWPTSATPATPASRRRLPSPPNSFVWVPTCERPTLTSLMPTSPPELNGLPSTPANWPGPLQC